MELFSQCQIILTVIITSDAYHKLTGSCEPTKFQYLLQVNNNDLFLCTSEFLFLFGDVVGTSTLNSPV